MPAISEAQFAGYFASYSDLPLVDIVGGADFKALFPLPDEPDDDDDAEDAEDDRWITPRIAYNLWQQACVCLLCLCSRCFMGVCCR